MTVTRSCPSCQTPLPEQAHFCMHCGAATPTEPGVPPRTTVTGTFEVSRVRTALADRYRIERVIGEGGMATVYLAEDLKHHRQVAVKVMRPELAATLGADRFLREVEIAARLSHPHILPMYDSGEANGVLYYVMPFVEGESLQSRLKREGQLPVEEAVQLAREVAEALAYAHGRGIIHRDIKPANVLLSAGHALVADFGIARAVGADGETLTRTGLAVGTPQYMSPEQATGARDVDARADLYSTSAVLYEMLAGEPPFTGPTPQAIVARSLTESPRPLTATRENLPQGLASVVQKGLARSPADRYQDAQGMAAALRDALTMPSGAVQAHAAPAAELSGPSATLVWGLFAIGSIVGMVIVGTLVRRWGLPVWTLGFAVLLLAVGAAVIVTTGRVERERHAGNTPRGLRRFFTWTNAALGGAAALGLWAVVGTLVAGGAPAAGGGDGVSLAVLPFEIRGQADDSYLADGIADEIRGKLTGLPGFLVTARSSSDQYRGTTKSLTEIGRELGVQYLLTATVRVARDPGGTDRVQVVPELVTAGTGAATWQQTFDADLTDLFQVQAQIASRVAAALGIALGGDQQQQLSERPTENLAAWDLYVRARNLTAGDPATLKSAAALYDQAAALDTAFAEAWARLSISLVRLYGTGTPDPSVAARAREATNRALVLDRNSALAHYAGGLYAWGLERNQVEGESRMAEALRLAPNDPEILTAAGRLETIMGRWEQALNHFRRARRLDPRSVETADMMRITLLYMRQYREAMQVGEEALAMAPTDLNNIEWQAMIHLAQGDLESARRVIRNIPGSMGQPALVAYLATYYDLYWVLDDAQQQILLRLPPSAFFDDPAAWGSVFMQTYWHRGDRARARAYADTARMAFEEQLRGAPDDAQLHVLYGLALAYMGEKERAIEEGERGVALLPMTRDALAGPYYQHQLVRIYLRVGEAEKALDHLEPLLRVPYYLSPGWLRLDPDFAALKGNPRFERLLAGS